ncbi:MAG: SPASM domain-containing protein [Flavobacteriales bacterium]|nr:SPASM domain-containing protein [Flavobacteriales bacterium]
MQFSDFRNYSRKLTARKIWNGLRVLSSYYGGRITGRTFHPAWPVSISVEPTTACNLGCPECPSGLKLFTRNTGNAKPDEVRSWLSQMSRHVTWVNFYFQGEPFIHPGFFDLVKHASQVGMYTSTSTNAHFLSPDQARKTVESGLDRLIISIDGTTQEVYEQYRVHGSLDKVLEGTRNIVAARKELKSKTPHLIFQFLVVKPNEHQVADVKKLARDMGVDEVKFKTAQVYEFEHGNPLIPENEKYSRYKKKADGTYRIKNELANHCWRMWSACVITWDGMVVPCCFDKDATHRMGSLRTHRFSDIWNNPTYRNFRAALFSSRRKIDICANCSEGTKVWTDA